MTTKRPKLVRVYSHDKDGSCRLPEDVAAVFNLMDYVVITSSEGTTPHFIDVYPRYEVNEYGDCPPCTRRPEAVYYMTEKESALAARKEIVEWVRNGCPEQEGERP